MSSQQYLRKCSLIVANDTGDGLDLSQLRIVFEVDKSESENPNTATIKVYNLADATARRIQSEFTQIRLQAGYEENHGLIFVGTIRQCFRGRENNTDTYLTLVAGDGDTAYNFAIVNSSLAAGASHVEQINSAVNAMAGKGASLGYLADVAAAKLPRGKVMFGMARDYLRQSAESTGTSWNIQDGKVQLVNIAGLLPSQAVVLNSKSGLVGTPEQTSDGINVKCLINPMLRIAGRIKINEEDIARAQIDVSSKDSDANKPVAIASDGIYRILKIKHNGDTRGQDWYSSIVCVDVDATSPEQNSVKGS